MFNFYRPQRSCKGYVFTGVCLSTGRGQSIWPGAPPWQQTPPRPGTSPGADTPPGQVHPRDQVHPESSILDVHPWWNINWTLVFLTTQKIHVPLRTFYHGRKHAYRHCSAQINVVWEYSLGPHAFVHIHVRDNVVRQMCAVHVCNEKQFVQPKYPREIPVI